MNEINSLLDAFCQLLTNLSKQDKKIEIVKEMLCQSPDFEPYTTFKRLDRQNKNFIDCLDVNVFLEKNSIHIDTNTIFNTIFHRYCETDELSYLEFLKIVLPSDHPNLRTIVSQRPAYNLGLNDFLNDEIEYTLAKLLEAEIECYCNVEEEKRLIYLTAPKLEAIINFIDIDSKNYIDFTDLLEFFKKRYFFPYEEELISILKRIDTNDDGILEPYDFFLLFQLIEKNIKSNQNDVTMTKSRMENFKNTNTCNSSLRNQENKSTPKKRFGNFQIRKSISPLKGQNLGSGKKDIVKLENYPIFKNYKERRALESSNNTTIEKISDQHEYQIKVKKENSGKLSERLDDSKREKEKSLNENNLEFSQIKTTKTNEQKTKEAKSHGKIIENDDNEEDVNFRKKHIKNNQLSNELEFRKLNRKTENSYSFSNDLKLQEKARKFFDNLVSFNKNLEIKKTDLVLRPDFNIVDLFFFLDPDSKGFLVKENFDSFFCKNSINVVDAKQFAFLLFRKYDKNELGIIKFSEFTDFFCPHSEELVKLINKRKPINYDSRFTYGELFSSETRILINEILTCFYENEKKMEDFKIKDILEARKVFKLINKRKNGCIDKKELSEFIENKSESEVDELLEKIDFDKDGRLSLEDFLVNISA